MPPRLSRTPPLKEIARCRLYGILDLGYVTAEEAPRMALRMAEGGVDILQLRGKGRPTAEIKETAEAILPISAQAGIPFIINDLPGLVPLTGAQGAHIGQDDGKIAEARRLAGPGALVGRSTHSIQQALDAEAEGADYIGFGPLIATPTKPEYLPIGLEDIRRVHERVRIPIFCIGGIKRENLEEVLAAGASRVVIVSGLLEAAAPAAYARSVKKILSSHGGDW